MRTRTLALTAAISAIGAAAMADVVSVNVVGFVNKNLSPGFNLLTAPLKATNDVVGAVIPTAPNGTSLQRWNATAQQFDSAITYDTDIFGGWENPDLALTAGEAFFVKVEAATTLTFVGEVRQGDNLTTPLAQGFSMVGSQVPQAGPITDLLGFVPSNGDSAQKWDAVAQSYKAAVTFDTDIFGGWEDQPALDIAEGVVLLRTAAGSWTRSFHVQ